MSNGSNISNLQTFIFFKYLNSSIFVEFQIYWIVQNYSSSRRTLAIWIKNTFESGTKIRCKFEATWLPAKHKISIISLTFVLGKGNLTRKRVNLNETQHLKAMCCCGVPEKEYLDISCFEACVHCRRIRARRSLPKAYEHNCFSHSKITSYNKANNKVILLR